jgi:hypothetical protein
MADWRTIKQANATDEVLDKLTEASVLYETYLDLARTNVYPDPSEIEAEAVPKDSDAGRPLGVVMNPSPTGIALYRTL